MNTKFKSFASATAHIKADDPIYQTIYHAQLYKRIRGEKIFFACFYTSAIILALKRSFVCMLSSFIVNDLKYIIKQKSER